MIVVHVTHEAVEKIGGIGAVIAGLMTAEAYSRNVSRTILLGPLLRTDLPVNRRLGEGGNVIYSTLDNILPPPWRDRFRPIERTYDVGIIYGTRNVCDPYSGKCQKAEVLLVDVFHANRDRLNLFKAQLLAEVRRPLRPLRELLGIRGVRPPGRAGLRGPQGHRRQRPGARASRLPFTRIHGHGSGPKGRHVRLAQFPHRLLRPRGRLRPPYRRKDRRSRHHVLQHPLLGRGRGQDRRGPFPRRPGELQAPAGQGGPLLRPRVRRRRFRRERASLPGPSFPHDGLQPRL